MAKKKVKASKKKALKKTVPKKTAKKKAVTKKAVTKKAVTKKAVSEKSMLIDKILKLDKDRGLINNLQIKITEQDRKLRRSQDKVDALVKEKKKLIENQEKILYVEYIKGAKKTRRLASDVIKDLKAELAHGIDQKQALEKKLAHEREASKAKTKNLTDEQKLIGDLENKIVDQEKKIKQSHNKSERLANEKQEIINTYENKLYVEEGAGPEKTRRLSSEVITALKIELAREIDKKKGLEEKLIQWEKNSASKLEEEKSKLQEVIDDQRRSIEAAKNKTETKRLQRRKIPDEIAGLIKDLNFFKSFTPEEGLEILSIDSCLVYVKKGEAIIREGSEGSSLYISVSGDVTITKRTQLDSMETKNIPIIMLKSGALFGEMSFIAEATRTTSVFATTPVTLLKLNKRVLSQLSRELEMKVREVLTQKVIERLNKVNELLAKAVHIHR